MRLKELKEIPDTNKQIWCKVQKDYNDGSIVSERHLQSVLFHHFRNSNPTADVIVEPTWWIISGKKHRPDLVIVQNKHITDIFELKFVPHGYPVWRNDVEKLYRYVATPNKFPVALNPESGQWEESTPVHSDCRLHCVVISQHDAEAIDTPTIKKHLDQRHPNRKNPLYHWYGSIGNEQKWNIEKI